MRILNRLFGSKPEPKEVLPEQHGDYRIFVEPMSDGGGYRIAARIEKTFGDSVKSHHLIRADVCNSREEAEKLSLLKAKSLIDQLGDRLF